MVSRKTLPHVIYCRIWRFADLQNCNELKSVPHCQYGYNHHQTMGPSSTNTNTNNPSLNPSKSPTDDQMVCINPYHYTRIECSQQQQQPLTVYVPAKMQQQHPMDTLMPSVGPLVGLSGADLGVHDELLGANYMHHHNHHHHHHTNLHNNVNSPSPPPSASILSPSSIGE
jgi:hypothetical protein